MINRFRVWDKDEVKYVKNASSLMLSIDDTDDGDFRLDSLCPGRYIVEQYTGLKDKNGKEIYDGDLVEYDWYIVGNKPAYRVKNVVEFDYRGVMAGNDRLWKCTNVEVIGNIHENPELLGDINVTNTGVRIREDESGKEEKNEYGQTF